MEDIVFGIATALITASLGGALAYGVMIVVVKLSERAGR